VLYEHIGENLPENLLELGTARGGSAVFIAPALEASGAGHLTSVDSTRWQWLDPTPGEVLEKAGLSPVFSRWPSF
jgi:predicted O-methyltransferase YrrM